MLWIYGLVLIVVLVFFPFELGVDVNMDFDVFCLKYSIL